VARKFESGCVRLAADLRVTDSNDIRRGYPYAVLKALILSRTLVVAFAGNAQLALHTVRQLPRPPEEITDVIPTLTASCERAGDGEGRVDYLAAVAGEGIWRITNDGVEGVLEAAWIGDHRAFELYQRAYHEGPVALPLQVPSLSPERPLPVSKAEYAETVRMMNGIFQLVLEDSINTVGEAFILAASLDGSFRYEQQAHLAADHERVISGAKWVAPDWGTVAEGGFGYSTLVPCEPGIGVLGLYFPHPGLGLLYHPLARDDPFVYRHVTHAGFRARVLEGHGVELVGPDFGSRTGADDA
jgi:hypothetical protein